jgi:hypothetical protein
MTTIEQTETGTDGFAGFTGLAREIYKDDPRWRVRPDDETIRMLDRAMNPYWRQADRALFLARENGRVVGRIAAMIDPEVMRQHGSREGFFGFFECHDDPATAGALLDAAADWLAGRGCDTMHGPFEPLPDFDGFGLLVDGFDEAQVTSEPFNPEFYPRLFVQAGMQQEEDYLAFRNIIVENPVFEKTMARVEKILARHNEVTVRSFDVVHFDRDEEIVREILTRSFEHQPLYSSLDRGTQSFLLRTLATEEDMHWFQIAELRGRAVGINLMAPNYDDRLFGREVRGIRSNEFCILPEFQHSRAAAALQFHGWNKIADSGCEWLSMSYVKEFHTEMHHLLESFGSERYKRFRLYTRPIPRRGADR